MTLKLNGTNSVAVPAYAGDDADTGLQCGTNELKLVTGGSARATVDSSGRLLVGSTTTQGSQPSTMQIKGAGGTAIGVTLISGNDENAGGLLLDSSGANALRIDADPDNNRNGTYIRFATDGTTRARIDSDGLKFNTDTAAANALDDYEQGTFTCTFSNQDNNVVGSGLSETGHYIKIGHLVHFNVYFNSMTITSTGTSAAGRIRGLPFTARNVSENYSVANFTYNTAFTSSTNGYVNVNDTTLIPVNNGTTTVSQISTFSGKKIMITGTYYVA